MGSTQKDSQVSHFSHPHLLEHTTTPSTTNTNCFGCKLKITHNEEYYNCKTCSFSLHNVCYKTPLITNHPSHPNHDLFLLVTPSSSHATKSTLKCMACKQHVIGFSYHCPQCNIFFHSLCITLPLSLSITHHPHKLKLEFLPPYDFFCDLCNKPCYKGWLYRCNMCEFDIHIACAVQNIKPHFQQGCDNNNYYKIMNLVSQKIGVGNRIDGGWDKKLFSPLKKHSSSNGKNMNTVELELQETEQTINSYSVSLENLEERVQLRHKMTPLSDDTSPLFSDSYFSIDLNKSYSIHHEHINQLRKEVNTSDYINSQNVVSTSSRQGKEEQIGVVNYWLQQSHKDKMNALFFKGGSEFEESSQKVVVKNPTITTLEPERNKRSGWKKLLNCCL